jgi:hypothetical protein
VALLVVPTMFLADTFYSVTCICMPTAMGIDLAILQAAESNAGVLGLIAIV